MDRFIAELPANDDGDLMVCPEHGVAYQRDMTAGRVPYDAGYLAKVGAYEDTPIARAVNAGRCALVARHLPRGAAVLDYGAGSGAFVRSLVAHGYQVKGFDVIPGSVARLLADGQYADVVGAFDAVTLWDCIEHLETPEMVLGSVRPGSRAFCSLPIFAELRWVRASKHYRPGEHLYYWTDAGFVEWMARHGFRLLERSAHEVEAGRESIGAFAFLRA